MHQLKISALPQQKDVVIDAKVSLKAWEEYCSADTDEQQDDALKSHLLSIRNHIKNLSNKEYEKLQEINSLDYVLMFVPLESALTTALKHDHAIFTEAFSKNIILVSPSTLLIALKTISFTWKIEYQNRNAKEIARRAGNLYDKFAGFVSTLTDASEHVKKSSDKMESAIKLLGTGKGNLIGRVQHFKKMGVNTKKELPAELLELEDDENGNGDD